MLSRFMASQGTYHRRIIRKLRSVSDGGSWQHWPGEEEVVSGNIVIRMLSACR